MVETFHYVIQSVWLYAVDPDDLAPDESWGPSFFRLARNGLIFDECVEISTEATSARQWSSVMLVQRSFE